MDIVEQWMDVPHYQGLYQVSNLGRLWSVRKQKIMHPQHSDEGYLDITLVAPNGKLKYEKVHRLVALAFIPNPNHYPVINHKNEIKDDNRVENLEWCTVQYNTQYSSYKWCGANNGMNKEGVREKHPQACQVAHYKESRPVTDKTTGVSYRSVRDAEKQTGISRYHIQHSSNFIIGEIGGGCRG